MISSAIMHKKQCKKTFTALFHIIVFFSCVLKAQDLNTLNSILWYKNPIMIHYAASSAFRELPFKRCLKRSGKRDSSASEWREMPPSLATSLPLQFVATPTVLVMLDVFLYLALFFFLISSRCSSRHLWVTYCCLYIYPPPSFNST